MVELLSQTLGPGKGEAALDYGLAQLQRARLLQDPIARAGEMSRRAAMRRIGLAAAVGLPIVTSLVAPPAIHAQAPTIVTVREFLAGTGGTRAIDASIVRVSSGNHLPAAQQFDNFRNHALIIDGRRHHVLLPVDDIGQGLA